MSRKNKLSLPPALKEKFAAVLGGKTPTTDRLLKLLEGKEKIMDQQDVEAGRQPYSAREHIAALPPGVDPELALENVAETQARRAAEGRERVADRIADHRARGLDPSAPPLDAEEARLAEEHNPLPGAIAEEPPQVTDAQFNHAVLQGAHDDIEIERLKTAGTAKVRQVAETLERQVLQRMPSIKAGGGRLRSLEEAAEVLIAELQVASIDAIRQVCEENGLEPWVVVLGAVDRMANLQELHAGEFDPEWLNRTPGGSRPSSIREQKCEMCGGILPSDARRGQKACCNNHGSDKTGHSEGCSLAYLEMRQGRWVDTRGLQARS